MNTPSIIRGYVTALPRNNDDTKARVAIEADGISYHVMPRGAGIDLDDHLSSLVQISGLVCKDRQDAADRQNSPDSPDKPHSTDNTDKQEIWLVNVRSYELLEDDSWLEDE